MSADTPSDSSPRNFHQNCPSEQSCHSVLRPQKLPAVHAQSTCRTLDQLPLQGTGEGILAEVIRLPPRPNYRQSFGLPADYSPSGTKKPRKLMIYRAFSINMAPDVGIEPTTHWLTESRVTFHVRVSLRKLTCLFCKPSTRSR